MSRIKEAFAGGKAFIPFLTCGDPDLETTEAIVHAMAQAGADLIELGIPFSDPTAEGPVIQAANARALSGGVTADSIFALVRRLRRTLTLPLVFMTYANVVFSYGTERFLSAAAAAGVDGLILPDVPFEEKEEFAPLCRKYGLDLISLIAPTSAGRITRSPGRRRASSTACPPWASPACAARSPQTWAPWWSWSGGPTRVSPAPWASGSPRPSRRPPWPLYPTGPSLAPPS